MTIDNQVTIVYILNMNMRRNPAERWAARNSMTPDQLKAAAEAKQKAKEEKAAQERDAGAAFATLNPATKSHRDEYVKRAEEVYMVGLVRMREALAAVGMDLNKVAPYPRSTVSGKQYRMALATHKRYTACFHDVPGQSPVSWSARLHGTEPWMVVEIPDVEPKVRAAARQDANACFDSFLYKLAEKIGKAIKTATLTGVLWDGCTLKVECQDGEAQVWNTKCIINQSVYGKLFNQWPTRRAE